MKSFTFTMPSAPDAATHFAHIGSMPSTTWTLQRCWDEIGSRPGDARWIGRHLMQNGRALAAYREGQAILAEVDRAD